MERIAHWLIDHFCRDDRDTGGAYAKWYLQARNTPPVWPYFP